MLRKTLAIAAAVLVTCSALTSSAQVIPMDWISTSEGTIGPVSVSLSGLSSSFLEVQPGQNFTLPDWDPPLTNVERIVYGASNDWTATFSNSVSNLLVYVESWRGSFNFEINEVVNYTFDQPFVIQSGLTGAIVTGNTLTLDDSVSPFFDGILQFPGPINSLSVISDGLNESGQAMTFAVIVPEPSAALIGAAGALVFCASSWSRRLSCF